MSKTGWANEAGKKIFQKYSTASTRKTMSFAIVTIKLPLETTERNRDLGKNGNRFLRYMDSL